MTGLRELPSVDHLLNTEIVSDWSRSYGRSLTTEAIRNVLNQIRDNFREGNELPGEADILVTVEQYLKEIISPTLIGLINATGVILHTNLGRAPLSREALSAINKSANGYSNLEYDLQNGKRGSRLLHAEQLITRLTKAQAALVVNNNAAAVLLILTALAKRRAVVIARSQLVEIGGGFRVPDVMKQSGARLVEVGTTNRVHMSDYETALQEKPVMILRAHRSNFQIVGFTSEPSLSELADLAHKEDLLLVDDLGSGSMLDTSQFGLGHEPMVQESLLQGADLVCFSGDKLLGGPQAGIIAGRADLVTKLKKHSLARAIRADKLCLAGLSATLIHYLKDEAISEIPVWKMISISIDDLEERARKWQQFLELGEVIVGDSTIGGGSLPGEILPTRLLGLRVRRPDQFMAQLRKHSPPIIARLEKDLVLLDPRTVLPEQDDDLLRGLKRCLDSSM